MPDPPKDESLPSKATRFYHARNFTKAREVLAQLKAQPTGTPNDLKVQVNMALCEFLLDSNPSQAAEKALVQLLQVQKQLSSDVDDHGDGHAPLDPAIVSFNIAIMQTYLKRHSLAIRELESMLNSTNSSNNGTASNSSVASDEFIHTCAALLVADLYMLEHKPNSAVEPLALAERRLHTVMDQISACRVAEDNDNSNSPQPENADNANANNTDNEDVGGWLTHALSEYLHSAVLQGHDLHTVEGKTGVATGSDLKISVSVRRARLCLLQNKMKGFKKEIKTLLNACTGVSSRWYVYLVGSLFKCQLEYLRGNQRKTVRLLMGIDPPPHTTPNPAKDSDSMLPACVVNLIGGHSAEAGRLFGCVYYNNMGLALMRVRKFAAALQLFSLALQECLKLSPNPKSPLQMVRQIASDKRFEVVYNTGVCLLMAGDIVHACKCFTECSQVFNSSALLWLRIAECCVAQHTQDTAHHLTHHISVLRHNQSSSSPSSAGATAAAAEASQQPASSPATATPTIGSPNIPNVGGSGLTGANQASVWVVLHNHSISHLMSLVASDSAESEGGHSEDMTLEVGLRACRNSLRLIPTNIRQFLASDSTNSKSQETQPDLTGEFSAVEVGDMVCVFAMAHLNLCKIGLGLSDPHLVLSSARSVLAIKVPKDTPSIVGVDGPLILFWKFYAHVYAAEACFALNMLDNALTHLQTAMELQSFEGCESDLIHRNESSHRTPPPSPQHFWARATANTLCNLAIVLAAKGELDKAHATCHRALTHNPNSMEHRVVFAFVLARQGLTTQAVSVLRGGDIGNISS